MNPMRTLCLGAAALALVATATFARADDPKDLGTVAMEIATRATRAGATGAIVAIALAGKSPIIAAAGTADVAANRPMDSSTPWHVASVTKLFVATVALELIRECVLELDAPIATWLPDAPDGNQVTLRQLLNHSSGIADYANEAFLAARPNSGDHFTADELLGFRDPKTLLFPPGTQARYSNSNYLLLGQVIEAATGRALEDELRARVLGPLGLAHTLFAGVDAIPPDLVAHGYADLDGDGDLDDTLGLPWTSGWADNAIVSDAADLIHFIRALFSEAMLDADLRTAMLVPVLERDAVGQPVAAYGLGIELRVVDGVTWVGHSGSTFGYLTGLWYQPQSGIAVAVGFTAYPKDKNLLTKLVNRAIRAATAKDG